MVKVKCISMVLDYTHRMTMLSATFTLTWGGSVTPSTNWTHCVPLMGPVKALQRVLTITLEP
jgi:hypothetical protein